MHSRIRRRKSSLSVSGQSSLFFIYSVVGVSVVVSGGEKRCFQRNGFIEEEINYL